MFEGVLVGVCEGVLVFVTVGVMVGVMVGVGEAVGVGEGSMGVIGIIPVDLRTSNLVFLRI